MMRSLAIAAVLLVTLPLAVLQFASDAFYGRVGTRASLPGHLSCNQGLSIYASLRAILPSVYTAPPAVQCAVDTGDSAVAQNAIAALRPSIQRSELAGKLARMQGLHDLAARYFLEAADAGAVENEVDRLARSGRLADAFGLEQALRLRMMAGGVHPNAVADIDWKLNVLATQVSRIKPAEKNAWVLQALRYDREAVSLSPYAERYYLAEGNRLLDLAEPALAAAAFENILTFDPKSADALAGLGLAALARAQLLSAREYATQSRAAGGRSTMLRLLEAALRHDPHRQPNTTFSPPRNP